MSDCRVCEEYTPFGDICSLCDREELSDEHVDELPQELPVTCNLQERASTAQSEISFSSCGSSEVAEVPEGCSPEDGDTRWRENAYKAGLLEPVEVVFPPLPPFARHVTRAAYEYLRLRFGLWFASGEAQSMPFAVRELVRAGIAKTPEQAGDVLKALVGAGVITYVRTLPGRNGMKGTKCYLPGGEA